MEGAQHPRRASLARGAGHAAHLVSELVAPAAVSEPDAQLLQQRLEDAGRCKLRAAVLKQAGASSGHKPGRRRHGDTERAVTCSICKIACVTPRETIDGGRRPRRRAGHADRGMSESAAAVHRSSACRGILALATYKYKMNEAAVASPGARDTPPFTC